MMSKRKTNKAPSQDGLLDDLNNRKYVRNIIERKILENGMIIN